MKRWTLILTLGLLIFSAVHSQPLSFSSRGIGGGGALFSPSINPYDPDEFYVACDMTELFHTSNFGQSYQMQDFERFQGGAYARVSFTGTPGLLYAIRYENEVATPAKSTDNGNSWSSLPGNPDPWEDIYHISVDRSHPNRVLISDYNQIYFSSDGGTTFSPIHTAATGSGAHIGGTFFDGDSIYCGTVDGVLVSTNAGTSWSMVGISGIPSADRISSFAAARTGNTVRFYCITGNAADVYVGLRGSDFWGFFTGAYRCDFGSSNWTPVTNGISSGQDFPMFVVMAENDIETAYIGGGSSSSAPIVLKTTNGGANWSDVFLSPNNQNIATGWSGFQGDRTWGYGEMPFGMAVSPLNADRIIFSDYGFVHGSQDGGTTWQQAYVDVVDQNPPNSPTPKGHYYQSIGLENTSVWQVHWSDANSVWGCFSDIKGIRSTDGGNRWSFDYQGHSGNTAYRVAEAPNGTLFMATSDVHDIYQSTYLQDSRLDVNDADGKVIYSTDQGATWNEMVSFGHPVFWIALDPSNADRAYASVIHYDGGSGAGGIYRCDDLSSLGTSSWTALPDPIRTEKHPASLVVLNDGKLLATYSGRRNGSGAFTASSGVFLYDPVAGSWTDMSHPDMHYWTKDVVVDPNDPTQNTWYVGVFSGWGGPPNDKGGLFRTTDRGQNWTKLTGNQFHRVTSCTFHPSDPNQLYLTTETQGLWMSTDINSATPSFSRVQTYPFRQPERVFFNPYNLNEMWVTSFGNGLQVGSMVGTLAPDCEEGNIVWPNPTLGKIALDWNDWRRENLEIYDLNGRLIEEIPLKFGRNEMDLGYLAPGIYFFRTAEMVQKVIVK